MSRALFGIKLSNILEPLKVFAVNLPGLNFVRNMFLLLFLPIEVSGIIFFLFTLKHFLVIALLFGFPRYNVLKFSESSSEKYIYSSIVNDIRLIFFPTTLLLLLILCLIDIVLPEGLNISLSTYPLIFLWLVLELAKSYISSFLLTFKRYLIVSFFLGNFFSIISILLIYALSALDIIIVLSIFLFASFLELLIFMISFYAKKLPKQVKDLQKSSQKIQNGIENFLFDFSEVAFYSLPVIFISFLADKNLFLIFNSSIVFFLSTGVLAVATRQYFFPKFAKNFSKKAFFETILFLISICVLGSLFFFFLLDLIIEFKPLLKEYKNLIFLFFVSGLFINFSFFFRTIYSLRANLGKITKINLFYLLLFISFIFIFYSFNILNLISISFLYLIGSGAYCFYTIFLTLKDITMNE